MYKCFFDGFAGRGKMQDQIGTLREEVAAVLADHPCRGRRWVAFSGGLDSTVLVHLLASLGEPFTAVHVNHGLSPHGDRWQGQCRQLAEALQVPLVTREVAVTERGGGLEEAARHARYVAFAGLLQDGDQLLTAHHGDDQVETFFLRLLRGAGVQGLAGMPAVRPLGRGRLVRPLLEYGRPALEAYARSMGLGWIEDESNTNTRFDRNYLRREILPGLRERWPVRQRVGRAIENLREAAGLLAEVGDGDLEAAGLRRERWGESVVAAALGTLSPARRNNLLRRWVQLRSGESPSAAQLGELLRQLQEAGGDRQPGIAMGKLYARRWGDRLYLLPPLGAVDPGGEFQWSGGEALPLPGGGTLVPSPGWPRGSYRVRFRRGGERAQPLGRNRSQTLKRLLQEWQLEPWLRDRVPLIFAGERLVAVGGLFVCQGEWSGPAPPPPEWLPGTFSD